MQLELRVSCQGGLSAIREKEAVCCQLDSKLCPMSSPSPFLRGTPFMQRCLWLSLAEEEWPLRSDGALLRIVYFRTCSSWYTAEIGGG